MAKYINGQRVETPEEKRAAVESFGGTYNENIEGNFVQGRANNSAGSTDGEANYVENLGGQHIVVDEDGEVTETAKRSG